MLWGLADCHDRAFVRGSGSRVLYWWDFFTWRLSRLGPQTLHNLLAVLTLLHASHAEVRLATLCHHMLSLTIISTYFNWGGFFIMAALLCNEPLVRWLSQTTPNPAIVLETNHTHNSPRPNQQCKPQPASLHLLAIAFNSAVLVEWRPPASSPASPTHCWGCGERQMMKRMKRNWWRQWRAIWASLQLQLARLARRTLWANAPWVFFSMSKCTTRNACTICSSRGILVRIFMVNILLALNHGSFARANSVGTTSSNIIGTYNIKLFPAHFCSVAPFRFDAPEAKVARVPQSHQSKQLKLLHREQQIHNSVKGWNYRNGTVAHSRLYTAKWI